MLFVALVVIRPHVVMLIILLAMLLVFLFNCKTYWELRTEKI